MFRKKPAKNASLSLQLAVLSAYFTLTVAKFIEFSSARTGSNFLLEWNNGNRLNDTKYFDPIVDNIKSHPEKFIYPSSRPNGLSFYKEADLCRELHRGQTLHSCFLLERNVYKTTGLGSVGYGFYQERTLGRSLTADREVISYVMDMINSITAENSSELYSVAYVDAGVKFALFGLATIMLTFTFGFCLFGGLVNDGNERRYRRD